MKNKSNSKTLKRVIGYVGKYNLLIIASFILAASTVILTLYAPILIGRAIDLIVGENQVDFSGIAKIAVKFGVVIGVTALLQWLMGFINNKITFQVARDIRIEAFNKLQTLPISYLDSNPHGEVLSRIISDVDQLTDGLLLGFTQLFAGVVTILSALIFMLRIDYKITLAVVVLTPLSFLIARFVSTHTYAMFKKQSETRGKQTSFINETISNLGVVKAFSFEDESINHFEEINKDLTEYSLKATFYSSLVNPSTRFINNLIYAVVALMGVFIAITGGAGAITVGQLSCFLSYTTQYSKPFNEISGVVTELQNSIACAARVFELLDEPSISSDADNKVLQKVEGDLTLRDVAFSYVPEKPLIEDLNLQVKPGQKIAIVGPTGCGKTTVINLLMRFYDVNEGAILVEGEDIRNVTRKSLRKNFGMVLQETWLKNGTIRENIAFGNPNATDEEIISAAKRTYAHNFIKRLPNGYDTLVTEGGGNLSAGQRQLLCITRVMLSSPPMLILDEATSSIDTRTELRIQKAFDELMKGKTSFIVAHRLSTIMEADVILVMRDGKIIDKGTHNELLSKKGFYYELYNSQFANN